MRIMIGKEGKGRFFLLIPTGLVATRIGAAITAVLVNKQLEGEQRPALPEAGDQNASPHLSLATQCQHRAITPLQIRQIGLALKESAALLHETGLPLIELHSHHDGTYIKVEL